MPGPSRSTPAGRRALLYMPGDSRRKIEKAATLDADSVCLDLEDGVALTQKETARATIAAALKEFDFGRSERLVRLNRFGSGLEGEDFAQTVEGRPDGFVIPKVESAEAVQWLEAQIAEAERARGWPPGETGIIAIVETARHRQSQRDRRGLAPAGRARLRGGGSGGGHRRDAHTRGVGSLLRPLGHRDARGGLRPAGD